MLVHKPRSLPQPEARFYAYAIARRGEARRMYFSIWRVTGVSGNVTLRAGYLISDPTG